MRGALVHDALYQLMRLKQLDYEQYRDRADEVLRDLCKEDGMSSCGHGASIWSEAVREKPCGTRRRAGGRHYLCAMTAAKEMCSAQRQDAVAARLAGASSVSGRSEIRMEQLLT